MIVFDMRHAKSQRGIDAKSGERRELLVQAARECFEKNGVEETSIVDITRTAGMVRELFYYYFPSKGAIRLAVANIYAQEALGLAEKWCQECESCDWSNEQDVLGALILAIGYLRKFYFTQRGERKPMFSLLDVEHPVIDFFNRVAEETTHAIGSRPAVVGLHNLVANGRSNDQTAEFLELIVMGIVGCMDAMQYANDEAIARVSLKLIVA